MKGSLKCFSALVVALFILIICYSFLTYQNADTSKHVFNSISTFMMLETKPSRPSVSLFVRMAGRLTKHQSRFYCDFFRTAVLFWPPTLGKTIVVLDEESELDHKFGEQVTRQVSQYFPNQKLEVKYEPLPHDPSVLNFAGSPKSAGYNRQLWSSFFIDLYTDDLVVAWMDSDAAFVMPVTESTIFNGTRIRLLGSECSMNISWVKSWAETANMALGLPMVVDFMTYFPVYLYRDTFTHCREYILNRFNTSNFEEAFKRFYFGTSGFISPVSVVISYAWFFEKDRYDWNFKICSDLKSFNRRFSSAHRIRPEHVENMLSQPQTAFHVPEKEFLFSNVLTSYCLSHAAAENEPVMCANLTIPPSNNLILFNHDLQRVHPGKTPCSGEKKISCLNILKDHYNEVAQDIKNNGRELDWGNLETVELLGQEVGINCEKFNREETSYLVV